MFGEGADRRSLARGDCLERIAVSGAASELDLYEDEGRSVAKDQVDLPASSTVVALN